MPMKVPKNATFKKHGIGNHLYLWSKEKGKPTSEHLIISAHGRTSSKSPIKLAANENLQFYCEHGYTQGGSMDIRRLASGYVKPRQIITSTDLDKDYALTKYQSADEAETYAYIAQGMHDLESYYRDVLKLNDEVVEQFLMQHKGTVQMDVLTIRNRSCGTPPTLFEALKLLQDNDIKYSTIHCSFCRGLQNGTNFGQQNPVPLGKSIFD
ncbi:conserved hypothetical protein [Vibrio harveyi]|uniref:putative adhesin n=1 Tax=Vibrio harveyi TaxID=669 RepID=UPI0003FFDFC3|nr:hypothetical protein [Vibrio harveyi]APP08710.1 hypothetical protein BG259_26155 [Vibrio harveyi]EKO3818934.1 hypothetical protein [Vibrio harveyi]EKO3841514.1 hypothetical protein [Vibrio harveyi]EKY4194418.1 hypothetical protein [Vibrio harveyi]ELV8723491.1 hypothetical protein [Vibrio harveyi]